MLKKFKRKKLNKDFQYLENKIFLLKKCSPGAYFLTATHIRNIILNLDNLTALNDIATVEDILKNIHHELELNQSTRGESHWILIPTKLTSSLFLIFLELLKADTHLNAGIVELFGEMTRDGKHYREINDTDKSYLISDKSLFDSINEIYKECKDTNGDISRRDEDVQNLLALADFRKNMEDNSLRAWLDCWGYR